MNPRERYFDNAATTPMDPRVLEAMLPFLLERFGNANSQHSFGAEAWEAVEHARTQVSRLLGAEDPSQIVFTSGAIDIDTFTVFILYQPTGGSWVPVQATDWNCQASYQHFLAGPQWPIPSYSDSITNTHRSLGVFPVWPNFRSP